MRTVNRVKELEKKVSDLENMVISLAQTVAEMEDEMTELKARTDHHDDIIEHLDEHVVQMFNEAYNNAARELSAGIDQVLNFTPYGVK